jgi:hypothetical protein
MKRLSLACEKNSDQPACLSTLGRLNLPCMTPVRAERVPLVRPHTGNMRKASGLCLTGRVSSANRTGVSR